MPKTCETCRWLPECQRDHGADKYDPACTGYVSASTDPALRQVLADALREHQPREED